MSIVPKETIQIIAQSMGLINIPEDVAAALAADVEYRMREIMQEAIKSMRHSKRSIMTTEDVSCALSFRNVEPLYRFSSSDPSRFRKEAGHPDIYYIDDRELDFKEVVEAPLPRAPLDTSIVVHWLAVEGVQPAIPENTPVEGFTTPLEEKKGEHQAGGKKEEDLPYDIKPSVKHSLSRELQQYFTAITELLVNGADEGMVKAALASLATDSGLHALVPYLTQFVSDEVTRSLDEFPLLFSLMRCVQSLLLNPHIHIEPYLHQLMPSVITCLVARRLGGNSLENHWQLRDFTARIVAFVCRRFGHAYQDLQPRVTRTLVHAFLDPKRAITQHYGAIQGLAALGSRVVRLLLLPNLTTYLQLLAPEMCLDSQPNGIKRYEAWRVYGALLVAVGDCLYEILKSQPSLLAVRSRAVLKPSAKVAAGLHKTDLAVSSDTPASAVSAFGKRPNSTTDLSPQPLQKKAFCQTSLPDSLPMPSSDVLSVDMEMKDGDATAGVLTDGAEAKRSQKESQSDVQMEKQVAVMKVSLLVKGEADIGPLLDSVVEMFGESMLPFVPTKELSLFV